jgi:predicted DNA-binding protein
MYTYIVQRTQIYLSEEETDALDREAARTGRTRSQLIREAIDRVYLGRDDVADAERLLMETAGAWSGRRLSGEDYVERLRGGRLGRLHAADR